MDFHNEQLVMKVLPCASLPSPVSLLVVVEVEVNEAQSPYILWAEGGMLRRVGLSPLSRFTVGCCFVRAGFSHFCQERGSPWGYTLGS